MKVFIIAGEASGDKLGAEMMIGLQHLVGEQVQFAGLGGSGMIGQGRLGTVQHPITRQLKQTQVFVISYMLLHIYTA